MDQLAPVPRRGLASGLVVTNAQRRRQAKLAAKAARMDDAYWTRQLRDIQRQLAADGMDRATRRRLHIRLVPAERPVDLVHER